MHAAQQDDTYLPVEHLPANTSGTACNKHNFYAVFPEGCHLLHQIGDARERRQPVARREHGRAGCHGELVSAGRSDWCERAQSTECICARPLMIADNVALPVCGYGCAMQVRTFDNYAPDMAQILIARRELLGDSVALSWVSLTSRNIEYGSQTG